MRDKMQGGKMIIGSLLLLFVVSIGVSSYLYKFTGEKNFKEGQESQLNFFNSYIIAVNDYHIANSYFDLGSFNLELSSCGIISTGIMKSKR